MVRKHSNTIDIVNLVFVRMKKSVKSSEIRRVIKQIESSKIAGDKEFTKNYILNQFKQLIQ